jgi:PHD/YefM family antitoxin component YafN of YafNO toxin-antitoxin module
MSEQVHYITNEQGERVGVLLDLDAYNRLANPLALDEECLIGLSRDELQALADSKLAPAAQNQLNDLLVQNAESQLSADVRCKSRPSPSPSRLSDNLYLHILI